MEGYENPPEELDDDEGEESLALDAIWDAMGLQEQTNENQ